jgi:HK97 family phage prohead protease
MKDKDLLKNKKINITSTLKNISVSEDEGIAYISGWASKAYDEKGSPIVDRDGETIAVKNFQVDNARVLLRDHELTYPVGKMLLTHKKEGLWIDAEVHEKMCDKTYYAVKNGILDSFSIGMIVNEAEYIDVKGSNVLELSAGEVYECSILSVPSNVEARVQTVKSIFDKDGNFKGLRLEKEMNKEESVKAFDKEKFKESIQKGLTIEETMNESWNISDPFWMMFSYFKDTVVDNFDTFRWEDITKEEMLANLELAFETFKETVIEVSTNIENKQKNLDIENVDISEKSVEGEKMDKVIKSVEGETESNPVEETSQEVESEEFVEENVDEGSEVENEESEEVVEENFESEDDKSEDNDEGEAEKADETTEQDDDSAQAEPLDVNKEVIAILSTDLNTASPEEIQSLYDSLAEKIGDDLFSAHEALTRIEQYVQNNI